MHNFSQIMQYRIQLYQSVRDFFQTRNVAEVETPILSPYGSTDVHIDSFITDWAGQPLYLQTSPEFAMKRLLANGIGDCFQLCKVFRNEPHSKRHRAEFTLLEWYRLGFSMYDLITEVGELIKSLCSNWQHLPIEIISYSQAFAAFNIDPHQDSLPTLQEKMIAHSGYTPKLVDNRDEWLDFFLVTHIEKHLGKDKLTFLTHYPASMAALAEKVTDADGNAVAERFELYYQGIELANGFYELTDAEEQRSRFIADNQQRGELGKPAVAIDKDFLAALQRGLPPCSGVAVGVDRLLMLKLGLSDINELFPASTCGVHH
ncbi:MAG: elongation factor P lysine(34) lysyltransferase [Gammaproteobacteria bacterium]|nr:MAG: elongation factor P lysine(34) lysyltransferase [Gammaproteobacteria bacterium]